MIDIESKTKGKYKTKLKFLEFVGEGGHITFISNEAVISGCQLSGLEFEGINFKLTIHEDFSIDLDELETNLTTEAQRGRLLDIIEEKTITSYRNRSVIKELKFDSTKEVKGKIIRLLLSVEVHKPINKLLDTVVNTPLEVSQNVLDNIDTLIGDILSEDPPIENCSKAPILQSQSEPIVDEYVSSHKENLENSFEILKQQKLNELKSDLEKKRTELISIEFQLKNHQIKLEDLKGDIQIIEDRIHNLQPHTDKFEYFFCISESENQQMLIDDVTQELIRRKVSKIKSINIENFMKLFSEGEFQIKLGISKDSEFTIIEDYKNLQDIVVDKLTNIDISVTDDKISYRGDLSWGQLVNKMVKCGFQQSPIFDQICGSNSYESKVKSHNKIES